MSQKTKQKTLIFVVVFIDFFLVVMIVLNQFLPEALSRLTKPKKLNNLARSINERPRPNQVPAKNVECRGESIVSN